MRGQRCVAPIGEASLHDAVDDDLDSGPAEIIVVHEQLAIESGVKEYAEGAS